ncbi:MAG: hypothetical protein PHU28_06940 [Methanosarcinaceae archaeon]|nr:hypothetical protein [Methanosarcinaceae archaeon]
MKSKMNHYFASMTLLSGFILALMGIGFALSVNLTRRSDPGEIAITYTFIGFGLSLILIGINLMIIKPKEYHRIAVVGGLILSWVGVGAFYLIYPEGWKYPNVTFVAAAYAMGICLLAGNAFANTVLYQIEERARLLLQEKTDKEQDHNEEDIDKEVQKALERSFSREEEFSNFNLGIKEKGYDFILGKALTDSEEQKITFNDDISEVGALHYARGDKLKVNDKGLDSASMLLAQTINKNSSVKNQPANSLNKNNTKNIRIFDNLKKIFKRHKNGKRT